MRPFRPGQHERDPISGTILPPIEAPSGTAEAHHRIANSLQILSALISRELRTLHPGEGRLALLRTQARLSAIADMHRLLQVSDATQEVDLAAYLARLCNTFSTALPAHRRLSLFADPVVLPAQAVTLTGILVTELVMNAAKHAYDADDPGDILVLLRAGRDGVSRLVVEDHGAKPERPAPGRGLGHDLIEATSRQLGGQPHWENANPGLRFVLLMAQERW